MQIPDLGAGEVKAVSNPIRYALLLDKTTLGPGMARPPYVETRRTAEPGVLATIRTCLSMPPR